jgi:hypothetical protein
VEIGEWREVNPQKYVLRGITLFVATVAAVGCSADKPKQEFTIPKALCGVSVPSDALSHLLPTSGKRLTVDKRGSLDDGHMLCQVNVDNHDMVVVLNSERIDAGDSAQNILQSRLSISLQKAALLHMLIKPLCR